MALALARKYRPKRFGAVAVQTHVSNTLRGAIARGRVAHGYLFCGPRGTGKTTLARVLAMALNCAQRDASGEPCGECASCQRIWSGSTSLDVIEIDAASNRGVDDARELRERAMYAPSDADRYKVYIVDEAHMLTREAWNALLKILEEPPPRVVFVFATTEPQKIAQAAAPVLSRLQRFDLKRITPPEIRARLTEVLSAEGIAAEPEAVAMLARAADGSMRDALSLTDQVLALDDQTALTPDRVRETLGLVSEDVCLEIIDLIAERRAGDVFATVSRLADAGVDFGALLSGLTDMLRAQLAIALGGQAPDLSTHARAALEARREAFSPSDLVRMLSAITDLEPRFRKSAQQQVLLEALLVRCALLDRTVTLEAVLESLAGTGGQALSALRPPPAGPTKPSVSIGAPSPASPTKTNATVSPTPSGAPKANAQASPTQDAALPALSDESLTARWPAVIQRLRQLQGKKILAGALEHTQQATGSQSGEIVIRLTEPNDIYEKAIEAGRGDLLVALRDEINGVRSVRLTRPDAAAASATPASARRLTAESAKAEEVATLRKKDRVLGAAIDALDLELVDER